MIDQPNLRPTTDSELKEILSLAQNVAIVGVSDKPGRASNDIAHYLAQYSGYNLYFVNPLLESFMGEKVYSSLTEISDPIDIVDVFRKVSDLPAVFDDAYAISPKLIWLQLGIADENLAHEANERGIPVVMDRCILVEHRRLLLK
ncbi:MAG: CoA-binding protein [Actinomycetes bacterium]